MIFVKLLARHPRKLVSTALTLFTLLFLYNYLYPAPTVKEMDWVDQEDDWPKIVFRSPTPSPDGPGPAGQKRTHLRKVTLAFVSCGPRLEEALTMLKSAIIFSRTVHLHLVGVADSNSQPELAREVGAMARLARNLVTFEIYPTWFPKANHTEWRSMFAPCSAQRLFFPSMFPHLDSVMYIDSDILFLSDVYNLWAHFTRFNLDQLAAMAAEDEAGDGWYNLKARAPYYGPKGLNAGIMLMNLTRMRTFEIQPRSLLIYKEFKNLIEWADQDILNILFHFYPAYLYELSCTYNLRGQHCRCKFAGDCSCHAAKQFGGHILHGNVHRFHKYVYASSDFLKDFYDVFRSLNTTCELEELYKQLWTAYEENEPCQGMSSTELLRQIHIYLSEAS